MHSDKCISMQNIGLKNKHTLLRFGKTRQVHVQITLQHFHHLCIYTQSKEYDVPRGQCIWYHIFQWVIFPMKLAPNAKTKIRSLQRAVEAYLDMKKNSLEENKN